MAGRGLVLQHPCRSDTLLLLDNKSGFNINCCCRSCSGYESERRAEGRTERGEGGREAGRAEWYK